MRKIFAVIRREIIARVRTKAFVVMTLLIPLLLVFYAMLPALMMGGVTRAMHVAIVDGTTDGLGGKVETALSAEKTSQQPAAGPRYAVIRFDAAGRIDSVRDSLVAHTGVDRKVDPSSLDGVLVLSTETLKTGKAEYLGSNTSSLEGMGTLERSLTQVLMAARLEHSGVDPALVMGAIAPADVRTIKVSDGKATGESGTTTFILGYVMAFLLYFSIVLYGTQTMTSVIEEKTSRIMEVLTSSLRPFQMLLGKVLGVGLTAMLQLGIWGGAFILLTKERAKVAGFFGVSPDAVQQLPIPSMPPALLVVFLAYFAVGFLSFGALYAAIGSMCNNLKETQQYAVFMQMVTMVGFLSFFALVKDPTGGMGVTMSFIPFFSPFVMPVRYSLASVPPVELVASLSASIVTMLGVIWLAGRIYRTGILMYGKKPTVREVLRWIRAG